MLCKFFESFEDVHRSSVKTDDSCEVHISDSEEEFPRFPKKSTSVKKTGNASVLPKTAPCDYSLAVKEWSFHKTESARLLQSSCEMKKVKTREKKQPVKSMLHDSSENIEYVNKKENLGENLTFSNLGDKLSLFEPDGRKPMLLEIHNVNLFPQSVNINTERCLRMKKPSKFFADCDLLNSVKVTPRVKKIKPQLLVKDASADVFTNSLMDFEISQEKYPAVSKNVGTSHCFTDMQSLTLPKVKKILVPQTADAKRDAFDVTSEGFVECEDMFPKMSKDANSFIDCSFLGDLQVTSKVKKAKVGDVLNDETRVVNDISLTFEVSRNECPDISESSGSLVNHGSYSGSQSTVKDDDNISDYSDYSDHVVSCSIPQSKSSLNRKTDEKCNSIENFNVHHEGNEDLQKTSWSQNVVSSINKGSDFVKSIKLHQESVPKPKKELEVHSEKRKKYLPGGFAEQAQRLEQREKSSFVLWSYQKGARRYLSLKILLFSVVDSFVIAKCEILKDSSVSVEQNAPLFNYVFRRSQTRGELKTENFFEQNNSKESSSDLKTYVCSNISGQRREKFKHCLVAIKIETWEKLKLTPAAVLRIFPPWQSLWIDSLNVHVLLCTYFIEVLSIPPAVEKSSSEKVLYSRDASYPDVIEKRSEALKSPDVSCGKRHSSSSILMKLNEKRKLKKSFSSVDKTVFSKKITRNTKVGELVVVTGQIVKINEENSMIWFECDQCQSENLVEDEQGVTYCEVCSKLVHNPVKKMKMEVVLQNQDVPDVVLVVKLFRPTVEKIFPLTKEGQPQCGVSDILHTSVGPIVCSVISFSVTGNEVIYHLKEIS